MNGENGGEDVAGGSDVNMDTPSGPGRQKCFDYHSMCLIPMDRRKCPS
jgi:hypothetical protein